MAELGDPCRHPAGTRPCRQAAEMVFDLLERVGWRDVAGDDDGGVARRIIAFVEIPNLVEGDGAQFLRIADSFLMIGMADRKDAGRNMVAHISSGCIPI